TCEAPEEWRVGLLEGLRLVGEVDEEKAFPCRDRDRQQRIIDLAEVLDAVGGWSADEAAVEPPRPRVIRALDRLGQLPRRRRAESRAPVAAHVVEGAERARVVTEDDHALRAHLLDDIIARLRELRFAAD